MKSIFMYFSRKFCRLCARPVDQILHCQCPTLHRLCVGTKLFAKSSWTFKIKLADTHFMCYNMTFGLLLTLRNGCLGTKTTKLPLTFGFTNDTNSILLGESQPCLFLIAFYSHLTCCSCHNYDCQKRSPLSNGRKYMQGRTKKKKQNTVQTCFSGAFWLYCVLIPHCAIVF